MCWVEKPAEGHALCHSLSAEHLGGGDAWRQNSDQWLPPAGSGGTGEREVSES